MAFLISFLLNCFYVTLGIIAFFLMVIYASQQYDLRKTFKALKDISDTTHTLSPIYKIWGSTFFLAFVAGLALSIGGYEKFILSYYMPMYFFLFYVCFYMLDKCNNKKD